VLLNLLLELDFQPDWVWIKSRSGAFNHGLWDSVRGTTKLLISNLTNAESTDVNTVTSFDSDGFTLGTSYNGSGTTYASWNWLGANTTVSNTAGSITSTVSANTTSGFSIVSYTGNGQTELMQQLVMVLGSSIDFVIVIRRNTTSVVVLDSRTSKVGTGIGQ
jgi:hypothetical protein